MKILNLNTSGGEFYLMGTTQEYVGAYWIDDSGALYVGRSEQETPTKQPLVPIPMVTQEYNKTSSFQLGMPIVQIKPKPTTLSSLLSKNQSTSSCFCRTIRRSIYKS